MVDDAYGLSRFVQAQNAHGTYDRALDELRHGQKMTHWMWFVFPQLAGLGHSQMARTFAISSLAEAQAYLRHAVLGQRLTESARVVANTSNRTAQQLFGGIDALKLHSSMTLFARAEPAQPLFQQILERYFDGLPDAATDQLLESSPRSR